MTQGGAAGAPILLKGVPIAPLSEREVIDRVITGLGAGNGGWLVNPNLDVLRTISRRSDVRALVAGAHLVVADGMPLIWASRVQGQPLPERVAGSDLIFSLTTAAAAAGIDTFLLGGDPGVAEAGARALGDMNPGLNVGWHYPPHGFEVSTEATTAIHDALDGFSPAIVFCGLGFPKQEHLMADLHERFPGSWFIGSGAALGFAAQRQSRAPIWMQRLGLEWLHRLAKEPRRLFRRYIIDDVPFGLSLLASSVRQRLAR